MRKILSAFGKLAVLALIAVVFAAGLLLTVYLSLRSPEIQVPEVVNQSYLDGEATLERAGLDIRERAKRYKPDVQPGIILDQSPRPGTVIKAGQTVAVVVSRAPKEGERPPDEAVAEERREEEEGRNRNTDANANRNANRERRKPSNKNANANANSGANANGGNGNAGNGNSGGRNANAPRNTNLNANSGRPRNSNAAAPSNSNTRPRSTNSSTGARPAGANANRRPNP